MTTSFHSLPAAEALRALESGPGGLASGQASARLAEHGPNELLEGAARSRWRIFAAQFQSTMAALLAVAAVASFALGDAADMIAIVAILLLNGILGYVQEHQAEQAVAELRRMASPAARVRRDGAVIEIESRMLVPGDVILLEAGQIAPADARLLETASLAMQESALTGESDAVEKDAGATLPEETVAADRVNTVFAGTVATRGRGVAVITATGMKTEVGRIAHLLGQTAQDETPLQKRLEELGRKLVFVALLLVGVLVLEGLWRGESWRILMLTAISVAVAAVPEGLPVAVTIALALGARRMLARKALIRRLAAVETLGSVDVICSDKTGTLTENRMTVVAAAADGETLAIPGSATPAILRLLTAGALCNDAQKSSEGWNGDPTETALTDAAQKMGLDVEALRAASPRTGEVPFSSETKRMITAHADGTAIVKGASDAIYALCSIPPADLAALRTVHDDLAKRGQRILAFAEGRWDGGEIRDARFLGFLGMVDPPRADAARAIAACVPAGIRTVMITGDHPVTAQAIAAEIGIPAGRVTTGKELASLSPAEFDRAADEASVHARVAPEQKLMIVDSLRARGHVVAMTGDGVNDAPALKRADIGVAMGVGGTDVARQASDMVLLDNSFATIVEAVREGRVIYTNLRKFVLFLLACNTGELFVMLLGPLLGMPLPLLPLQILWMNLVTDGLPALALGADPPEPGIMDRPPRPSSMGILGGGLGWMILATGAALGMVTVAAGWFQWRVNDPSWQTLVFSALTLSQLAVAFGMRSEVLPLTRLGLTGNRYLLAATAATTAFQVAIVHVGPLQRLFRTVDLTAAEWALTAGIALTSLAAFEVCKAVRRRLTA